MAVWYIVDVRDGAIVNTVEASSEARADRIRQRSPLSHRLSLLPETAADPARVAVYEQAIRDLAGES